VRDYFDWIGTPGALSARKPAVSYEAFPLWHDLQQGAAKKNSVYDFHAWCGQQDATISAGTMDERVCSDVAPEEYGAAWEKIAAGRDQQRRVDLDSLRKELAAYHGLKGTFPSTGGNLQRLCEIRGRDAGCELDLFLDPSTGDVALVKRSRTYWYLSDGSSYSLYVTLESEQPAGTTCPSMPKELAASPVYCVVGP
jgi:hypothetical protein